VDDQVFLSASYGLGAVLLKIASDGPQKIWSGDDILSNHYATSVCLNGFLYGIHGRTDPGFEPSASLRCVELKTGKLMWDRDEHWQPHSTPTPDVYGRGSCIMADGKLIVLGEGGLLGLFKLDSQFPLPKGEGRGEGEGMVGTTSTSSHSSNGIPAVPGDVEKHLGPQPTEISRYQVPQLHYPCWSAPILSNKRLYLRSEDRLLCLNVVK